MTLLSLLDRTKQKYILIAGIAFIAFNVLFNLLSLTEAQSVIFNAYCEYTASTFVALFLFVIYSVAQKNKFVFSRTLLWLAISMAGWSIGDAIYLYKVYIKVDPFMSLTDLFYIAATFSIIVAILTIPGSQPPSRRRNMLFIEISILVLSAAVLSAILMLLRGQPDLNFNLFTLLMVFIYPVLDIILVWVIMILFFTYPAKNIQKVLGILFAGAICIGSSDLFYLVSSIYAPITRDYLADLGYYAFYFLVLAAGLKGFKEIREREPGNEKELTAFKSGNWIVFVPGVFLIIIIGLVLVFAFDQQIVLSNGIVILIVCIIVLFILHQYMVIADNIKLTKEMRQINAQLEGKVEQRTAELTKTNIELQDEMMERARAEEHLARSNQDLALLNRDKDKLFSILAHDLRSPLGSMMNLSELLMENIKDFDESELLEIIGTLNKSATQTFQLFNDLLAWSAIQMGRGEREKELFAVSEIISENLIILATDVDRKQIYIHSEVDNELVAYADKFAIQTVVRNLISNAVKFTQPHGNITITAEQMNDIVQISVIDNGVGISKEKQKRIFKVDGVSSTPGTEGEKGTGFGLLLCKDLVERNGGKIWLESEKDKGSAFHFTLPFHENSVTETKKIPATRIQYTFDDSLKIGFTTMTGEINLSVLLTELSLMWNSPDFHPEYSALADIREASFILDTNDMPAILETFSAMPGNKKNKKFAMLTATPQQVAFSTMFGQNIKGKYPFTVEIFSTYEAALNWLGA